MLFDSQACSVFPFNPAQHIWQRVGTGKKYKPWKTYLRFQSREPLERLRPSEKEKKTILPFFFAPLSFILPGFLASFLRVFLKPFVVVGFSLLLSYQLCVRARTLFLFFFLCVSMSPSDSSTLVFLRRFSLWCFLCNGVLAWWCFSSLWCFLSVVLPWLTYYNSSFSHVIS